MKRRKKTDLFNNVDIIKDFIKDLLSLKNIDNIWLKLEE
jgi:hypothetical protein